MGKETRMRRMINRLVIVVFLGMTAGCAAMRVATDYDPSGNFVDLKTYGWLERPRLGVSDPRIDNTLLEARVRNAVDEVLAAKGYRKKESGKRDFLVGYHAAIRTVMDLYSMNDYYGYRYGWGWRSTDFHVYRYEVGSLVLDVVDGETKNLLWRGSAQAKVDRSATPEKREEHIRQAVGKILERFPP